MKLFSSPPRPTGTQRPASDTAQQRPAQQRPTQQRPAQQRPAQQRPAQQRPAQQRPTQQRPDTGTQFPQLERLGDIIVPTAI